MVTPYASALVNRTPGLLGGSGDLYGQLGIDPRQARLQMISQALLGLGTGLLSGNNWASGLRQGLLGASSGVQDARRNMYDEALAGARLKGYQRDELNAKRDEEAAQQRAQDLATLGQTPPADWKGTADQWATRVRLDPEGALRQYQQHELQHIVQAVGNQQRDTWVDPTTGETVRQGDLAPRWAPQQPQQPSEFGTWRQQFKADNGRYPNAKEISGWRQGGDVTAAQSANNAEIDAARKYLNSSGITWDEIMARSQQYDSTGLPNQKYDPYIGSAYRTALQHKVGEDPQFETTQQQLRPQGKGNSGGTSTAQPLSGSGTQSDPYQPQSESDMEAVQSGEFYVNPSDGGLYQKQ